MTPDAMTEVGSGVVQGGWFYITIAYGVAFVAVTAYSLRLLLLTPPAPGGSGRPPTSEVR